MYNYNLKVYKQDDDLNFKFLFKAREFAPLVLGAGFVGGGIASTDRNWTIATSGDIGDIVAWKSSIRINGEIWKVLQMQVRDVSLPGASNYKTKKETILQLG